MPNGKTVKTIVSKRKIVIYTILSTLLVETCLILVLFFFFYKNYEKFSVSASGASDKLNFSYKELKNEKDSLYINKDPNSLYFGSFGEIKYIKKDDKNKEVIINLNKLYIKKLLFLNILKDKKLIDKNILNYFLNLDGKKNFNIEAESFLNFLVLLNKIDKNEAQIISSSFEKDYKNLKNVIEKYKNDKKFEDLAKKLKNTESGISKKISSINKEIPDKIYNKEGFFSNENVLYVIKKLYDEKYYENINKVAKIYNIDNKSIISSIAVEQLRYLSTQRGYAKYIIQNNSYLTSFSKFSYGLGGIKLETARSIQNQIKKYNNEIYIKYFFKDSLKTDEELIEVLKTDFGGFLYTGGLIYSIEKRWKEAGFDISNKPGVLTTLYNMGNPDDKIPNSEPKVGGSKISISGEDMYFGEIGFLYYYYINYYIE